MARLALIPLVSAEQCQVGGVVALDNDGEEGADTPSCRSFLACSDFCFLRSLLASISALFCSLSSMLPFLVTAPVGSPLYHDIDFWLHYTRAPNLLKVPLGLLQEVTFGSDLECLSTPAPPRRIMTWAAESCLLVYTSRSCQRYTTATIMSGPAVPLCLVCYKTN